LESNWRWNVPELGWALSGMSLAAREDIPAHQYITDFEVSPGFVGILVEVPPASGSWVIGGARVKLAPNFPYGYAVHPD